MASKKETPKKDEPVVVLTPAVNIVKAPIRKPQDEPIVRFMRYGRR